MPMTDKQDRTLTKLAARRGGIQAWALRPGGDVIARYASGASYIIATDGRAVRNSTTGFDPNVERFTGQQEAITRVLLKRHLYRSMEEGKPTQYVAAVAGALRVLDHTWSEYGIDDPENKGPDRTRRLLARANEYDEEKRKEAKA